MIFEDLDDVDAWLKPMDYIAFWKAVAPYRIFSIDDREHCDGLISSGKVPTVTILTGLKYMARDGLRDRFGLSFRRHESLARQATRSVH